LIEPAVRRDPPDGKKKEGDADNGADRHLHKKEGGEQMRITVRSPGRNPRDMASRTRRAAAMVRMQRS